MHWPWPRTADLLERSFRRAKKGQCAILLGLRILLHAMMAKRLRPASCHPLAGPLRGDSACLDEDSAACPTAVMSLSKCSCGGSDAGWTLRPRPVPPLLIAATPAGGCARLEHTLTEAYVCTLCAQRISVRIKSTFNFDTLRR